MTDDDNDEDHAARQRRLAQDKVEAARRRHAGLPAASPGQRTIGAVIGDVKSMMPGRDFTAAQWEEHDAKVRASLARGRALELVDRRTERRHHLSIEENGGLSDAMLRFIASDLMELTPQVRSLVAWQTAGVTVLYGAVGRGKTYAALRWLLDHPAPTVGFAAAAELLGTPRATDEGRQLARRWKRAGAFVLDDLGTEDLETKPGERIGYLENIIDKFVNGRRSLLITTNAPREELNRRYRVRMASRFDRAAWMCLEGVDRRRPT